MTQPNLTIYPLDLGALLNFDLSLFTARRNMGNVFDCPVLAYIIMGGEKPILVDTGPSSEEFGVKHHRPMIKKPEQELPAALKKLGVDPASIETVIFSHLHWDHTFNLESLVNARFYVQESELAYAVAPLPIDRHAYEAFVPGITPPWMAVYDRIVPVKGDTQIAPGVKVILTPGHSPGSQCVVVNTAEGAWVIAMDTIPMYINWEQKIPSGLSLNLFPYYETFDKIAGYSNNILPGHDPKVLENKCYPPKK